MAQRVFTTLVCCDNATNGFTICVSDKKELYSFGKSNYGAHGHQDEHILAPKLIPSLKNIKSVDCGNLHTICLDFDGNVFTFGSNQQGQLGISKDVPFSSLPQKVNVPSIKEISCGDAFCICLSENGDLFSFGSNLDGELGIGGYEKFVYYPKKIESLKDVDFVECGDSYTICKCINSDIYAWGGNDVGQLGIGNTIYQNIPIQCFDYPTNIVDIRCGFYHTLVLTSNQEVYSCGGNYNGELGRSCDGSFSFKLQKIDDINEVVRISCGYRHSMCIDIYGDLYVFGENLYHQLGLGDNYYRFKPVKNISVSNVIDISSKGWHTLVKTISNEIFAFGKNHCNQIGIETVVNTLRTPIQVLKDNENIWYLSNTTQKIKSARN